MPRWSGSPDAPFREIRPAVSFSRPHCRSTSEVGQTGLPGTNAARWAALAASSGQQSKACSGGIPAALMLLRKGSQQ